MKTAYLQPGQLHVSTEPTVISTVLGSCVAVCLWDPDRRIGGANHYLLPEGSSEPKSPLRYAASAVEDLIRRVVAMGAPEAGLRAKVFGGASIIEALRRAAAPLGSRNVEVGLRVLREHGIPVTSSHTGGERGMKLDFHTDTGEAWVKHYEHQPRN